MRNSWRYICLTIVGKCEGNSWALREIEIDRPSVLVESCPYRNERARLTEFGWEKDWIV